MESLITNGIRITVAALFQPEYSKPEAMRFIFSYRILIENLSGETVQLLRRHWIIQDSNGIIREVEGEGVVGKKPILEPGQSHEYTSWCQLMTEIGKMYGSYLMVRKSDEGAFQVMIPEFRLIAPFVLN